jgi:hypothetical protein
MYLCNQCPSQIAYLTEGLPPPKPKRGSKSQPTKKVIPPLQLDSLGRPVFPLNIGDLTIHSIGEVNLSLVLSGCTVVHSYLYMFNLKKVKFYISLRGCHSHDRMLVGFTTTCTCAISAHHK